MDGTKPDRLILFNDQQDSHPGVHCTLKLVNMDMLYQILALNAWVMGRSN